ncbi:MAG: DegQ family serine endoprotease [Desulfonatronovibrionaceae bacterium]
MRKVRYAVFCFMIVVLFSAAQSWAALPEFADLAEKTGDAVVNISTVKMVEQPGFDQFFQRFPKGHPFEDFFDQFDRFFGGPQGEAFPREQRSLGSGFIISKDGYIVTNNHVIKGADEIKASFQVNGNEEVLKATVIGTDPETDLALLKVEADFDLPNLSFGESDKLQVGEWVMAIGNPFGLNHTVTAGIVSAKGRIIGAGPYDNFIQTDASINPGNSGGPLLNMDGEVVGINTAIVASGQGIGFAIPSDMAQEIIEQLRQGKKVSRGWLGVTIQNVDKNSARALGLDDPSGALVAGVTQGDPADKAGLKPGDVITAIDGKQVEDASDLTRRIGSIAPSSDINLTIWRDGREKQVKVTLGERDSKLAARDRGDEPGHDTVLGMNLRRPTQEEAAALGFDAPAGLLVTQVESGSAAYAADINQGDLILQANGREVTGPGQFENIIEQDAKPKQVLMLLINRQGQTLFRTIPLDE